MNISPLDIRKQTFRTVFRGADNEEVRVFLDLVASEQERLIELNGQLNERIRHCEDRLAEYKEIDQTLRNSVLTAERQVTESREMAQREANLVLQEAEWRAKQMLEDARERLSRLSDEIRDLQAKKDAYVQHFRSFLEAQMELLGQNENYLDGVNRLNDEVSASMSRARRIDVRPAAPPAPPRPGRPLAQPESETAGAPSSGSGERASRSARARLARRPSDVRFRAPGRPRWPALAGGSGGVLRAEPDSADDLSARARNEPVRPPGISAFAEGFRQAARRRARRGAAGAVRGRAKRGTVRDLGG